MDYRDARIEALENRVEQLNDIIVCVVIDVSEGRLSKESINILRELVGDTEDDSRFPKGDLTDNQKIK
tara:strand:- start:2931 stop:3134 length:204 start_codon:yes stop_codon:yes gene_type:complete